MKRIFFDRRDSTGKFPDGRVKLDVHFRDSDGKTYVWTPEWNRTRHFFLEAYRVERLNKPTGAEHKHFTEIAQEVLADEEEGHAAVNFRFVAIKLGDELKSSTSVGQVALAAAAAFDFDVVPHPHEAIRSVRAQEIYDSVMTLAERPIPQSAKLELLKKFILALTSSERATQLKDSLLGEK